MVPPDYAIPYTVSTSNKMARLKCMTVSLTYHSRLRSENSIICVCLSFDAPCLVVHALNIFHLDVKERVVRPHSQACHLR
jgi:hypothetical protein